MRKINTLVLVALILAVASVAEAQSRKVVGWSTVAVGGVLVAAAFDYKQHCYVGYYDPSVEQCRHPNGLFGGKPDLKMRYKRPVLMYSGVGVAAAGVVLLLLPENRATRDLNVQIDRDRFSVSRSVGW